MIRIALTIAFVLPLFLSTALFALESGPYLGLNAGANLMSRDIENDSSLGSFNLGLEPGNQGNLTLGYRLAPGSDYGKGRMELEIGYRQNKIDQIAFSDGEFSADGEVTVWDLMFNTFAEYPNQTSWTPYVGAGIGVAMVTLKGVEVNGMPVVDDDDLVLAYQLGFGVGCALTKIVELDIGYRFFGTSNPGLKDIDGVKLDSEYYAHNLQLGIRVLF
ncbi:MAG: outer membrane beta-barrel protein [Geopsychrobacter sp.]|nr:outer membrane beta-barrel protein [Geopsychrobacter sp.]